MNSYIDYHLIRSKKRRKTLSLQIKEGGIVVLYVPYHTPGGEIERFIKEKESWIAKRISENKLRVKEAQKVYQPGEKFLYLGEWYPLEIHETHHREIPLTLSFGQFILQEDHHEKARDSFIHWYKSTAREKIPKRVNYYSSRLQLFAKGVKITSARHRWGSCSRDDRLSISWRIIMAPIEVIDYVLIHELAHIREKNHSMRFWNFLESILPDYKKQRVWLKENGHLLQI